MQIVRSLFLLLVLAFVAGCASSGPGSAANQRSKITLEEIQESGVVLNSAYDIVRQFRPGWLVTRGRSRIQADATSMADDEIVVYEDRTRMGGVDYLRRIPSQVVQEIEFLSAAEALRLGPGSHLHGAIVVYTRVR